MVISNEDELSEVPQRKLTSILAADVVGYSRMMGVDENGTHKLLGKCRKIIDRNINRHGGRIFNTGGDSVMAEFASTVEAVRCAIEIQEELGAHNTDKSASEQMWFRIGLNVGDVIVEGDDLIGDGVNVAARMESIAPPGGICISGSVYELVRNKLSFAFENMGERSVKNIIEPVSVYSLLPAATPEITPSMVGKLPGRFEKKRNTGFSIVLSVVFVVGAVITATYFAGRDLDEDDSGIQKDTSPPPVPVIEAVVAKKPVTPESPPPVPTIEAVVAEKSVVSEPPTPVLETATPSEITVVKKPELDNQPQPNEPVLPRIIPSYFAGKAIEGVTRKRGERFVIEMTERGSAIVTIYKKDKPTESRKTDSGRWWINKKERVCFQFRKFVEGKKFCRIYVVEEGRELLVSGNPAKPKWILHPLGVEE